MTITSINGIILSENGGDIKYMNEAINLTNEIYYIMRKNIMKYDDSLEEDISYSDALISNISYRNKVLQSLICDMKELKKSNELKFNEVIFGRDNVSEEEFSFFVYNLLLFIVKDIKRIRRSK